MPSDRINGAGGAGAPIQPHVIEDNTPVQGTAPARVNDARSTDSIDAGTPARGNGAEAPKREYIVMMPKNAPAVRANFDGIEGLMRASQT
ncbi:MAG: hypothetical protein AAF658_17600, partial [Myxococcota bacterium]